MPCEPPNWFRRRIGGAAAGPRLPGAGSLRGCLHAALHSPSYSHAFVKTAVSVNAFVDIVEIRPSSFGDTWTGKERQ